MLPGSGGYINFIISNNSFIDLVISKLVLFKLDCHNECRSKLCIDLSFILR